MTLLKLANGVLGCPARIKDPANGGNGIGVRAILDTGSPITIFRGDLTKHFKLSLPRGPKEDRRHVMLHGFAGGTAIAFACALELELNDGLQTATFDDFVTVHYVPAAPELPPLGFLSLASAVLSGKWKSSSRGESTLRRPEVPELILGMDFLFAHRSNVQLDFDIQQFEIDFA